MPVFKCPHCGHVYVTDTDVPLVRETPEGCPRCGGSLDAHPPSHQKAIARAPSPPKQHDNNFNIHKFNIFMNIAPVLGLVLIFFIGDFVHSCSRPDVPQAPMKNVEVIHATRFSGDEPDTTIIYCHARNYSSRPAQLFVFFRTEFEGWVRGREPIELAPEEDREFEAVVSVRVREVTGLAFEEDPQGVRGVTGETPMRVILQRNLPGGVATTPERITAPSP